MRLIKNECLDGMKSPIRFVMRDIHKALVNIAPERMKEFESLFSDFTLEYLDKGEWICDVNPEKRHIRLDRQVVELLWAASFGYFTFYTKAVQGMKVTTKQVIDLTQNKEIAQAIQLLKWAYENTVKNEDKPWPYGLPCPVENPLKETTEDVADELTRCAFAALLHHELAHISLKHKENSIENNREADYAMADWILRGLKQDDDRFFKRALGIAMAFEITTARGIYTGDHGGTTHPRSYDRLINTLARYIDNPHHKVWAVIASTLKLHLDNQKIQTPEIVYDTFLDCVNGYAEVLSRMSPL